MIKPYFQGIAGHALTANIIVPYPGERLTPKQEHFKFVHLLTRMCVDRAFGILKMRWRILNGKVCVKDPNVFSHCISYACISHNFMVARNDEFVALSSDALTKLSLSTTGDKVVGIAHGSTVRDAWCEYLWKQYQAV